MKLIYNFTTTEDSLPSGFWQNRAFQYGDGLFETIIFRNGKIRFLPDHLLRLQKGAEALKLELPDLFTLAYLQDSIPQLALSNGLGENARVKIQVWRKPGGLYTPVNYEAEFLIITTPLHEDWFSVKNKVIVFEEVKRYPSTISTFKTCSSLPYVLAGIARQHASADDAILLDPYGNLSECMASNLFWWDGEEEKLLTPSLQTGCIEGIMRKQILRRASQLGIETLEVKNPLFVLRFAETVFSCNVAGIQFFKQVEGMTFQTENISPKLWELLEPLQLTT